MNCPFCESPMQKGYIPNGDQPVQWIPEGKKPSKFSFTTPDGAIRLENRFSLLKTGGYRADAWHCPSCKLVIAKTES